jgi:hypothetical protein
VADAVSLEECDELFDGVGGVADGEQDVERHSPIVAPIRLRVLKLKADSSFTTPEPAPKS